MRTVLIIVIGLWVLAAVVFAILVWLAPEDKDGRYG